MKRWLVLCALLIFCLSVTPVRSQQGQTCDGAPPIRLSVGQTGELTPTQPGAASIPLRVHDSPGTTARVVGQLNADTTFRVLAGPQCKEQYAWWQVSGQGVVGWIAEGDSSGYYVEPVGGPAPTSTPVVITNPHPTLAPITLSTANDFAAFKPGAIPANGSLSPLPMAPDFSNIALSAILAPGQFDLLQRNGFVLSPGDAPEFYTVYQQARDADQSLLITADSMLHASHLAFDKVQRTAESERLLPILNSLAKKSLSEADKAYQALNGTDWADAAKRTVAFLGTAVRLIDPAAQVPDYAVDMVTTEVANIENTGGIGESAIFPELGGENWSAYIPRGHYTRTDALKAYFHAMTYYGRMAFRLDHPEETKSALVLVAVMRGDAAAWSNLYEATAFFVGKSDALTVAEYRQIIDKVYGTFPDTATAVKAIQAKGIDPFIAAAQGLASPKLLNAAASASSGSRGLSLMGQPFAWDDHVFSQLTYDQVGTAKKPRPLPMGLDLLAALGSDRAYQILDVAGVTAFDHYPAQMDKLRAEISPLNEADWTSTLYGAQLYMINTLVQPVPSGYPDFMSNQPYTDRQLYSALGSLTDLKEDSFSEISLALPPATSSAPAKGDAPAPLRPPNYVEPLPLFWARLAALAEMIHDGLASRDLLNADDSTLLAEIASLARHFERDSLLELANQAIPPNEQAALDDYGDELEHLIIASADKPAGQNVGLPSTNPPPAAMIVDAATDPVKNRVLQIGVGRIDDLYAAVPIMGKLILVHGASYSYYEQTRPGSSLLNDTGWQQLLDSNKPPAAPDWTFSFLAPNSVDPGWAAAVHSYQAALVAALWNNPADSYAHVRESTNAADRFPASQLEPLAKAQQYEGRQLIEFSFGPADVKNAHSVVITARETWRAELHNNSADGSPTPTIGERGPYTIEMRYTLSQDKAGTWTVTDASMNGNLPPWTNTTQ